jgi:cytochrome bd-type quinol oxidase subunit 2
MLVLPLPMLTFEGVVPVARYLLLGAVCIGMRIAEGPGGVVWQLTALFLAHALVYAALLWGAAWISARALGALPSRARGAAVVLVVAACLLWALAAEPYVTPFGLSARTNLLGVLR